MKASVVVFRFIDIIAMIARIVLVGPLMLTIAAFTIPAMIFMGTKTEKALAAHAVWYRLLVYGFLDEI